MTLLRPGPTRFAVVLIGSSPKLHVALHGKNITVGEWSRGRFPRTLCGLRTRTVACGKQPELGACRRCARGLKAAGIDPMLDEDA